MKPFDPRLLVHARSARGYLAAGAVLALVRAASLALFAWGVAAAIVAVIGGASMAPGLGAVAAAVLVRVLSGWALDVASARAAVTAKAELRTAALERLGAAGPAALVGASRAGAATLLTRGIDALDGYFGTYLPQLILTAVVTPVLVVIVWWTDLTSGILVVVTLPLIPVFMILVGLATQTAQAKQLDALTGLSSAFLDLVGGLATLKIFGRQHRQGDNVRKVTEHYRTRTMTVLRTSFVSGFVLELGSTLGVAIVAVSIGFRLVFGDMELSAGLFVLLLVPDVFLPIRMVGSAFHASTEGLEAADRVFALIEAPAVAAAVVPATAAPAGAGLALRGVVVRREGAEPIGPVDLDLAPGTVTALVGPSGVGKSTLVGTLLGFERHEGAVLLDGRGVDAEPGSARPWLAWSGQNAVLAAGTIAQNVALGSTDASPDAIAEALRLAGAADLDPARTLGPGGAGLSGGQAQRVAAARAIHRVLRPEGRVLVLDEPSSALDAASEARLATGLREVAARGRVVLVVSHRAALTAAAGAVLALTAAGIRTAGVAVPVSNPEVLHV